MERINPKLVKVLEEEASHLRETGIPRCPVCQKPMKNSYDTILKKVSPYLWETACEHSKNVRLALG